jgi:hypothetical protein
MGRIKEVAGLIGDLASTFQKKEYYNYPEIEEIVMFLKDSDDEEAKSIAEWIQNSIKAVLNEN